MMLSQRLLRLPTTLSRSYSVKVKDTTGLAGYPVEPLWRKKLLSLYAQTLQDLQDIPEANPYRRSVESLCKHYNKIVSSTDDYEVVEVTVGLGQVEQMVRMAEKERELIADYKIWKPWETDESMLDTMDMSFRTSIGGNYKKRGYEKSNEVEDDKMLLEQLQAEVEAEKVRVAAQTADKEKKAEKTL